MSMSRETRMTKHLTFWLLIGFITLAVCHLTGGLSVFRPDPGTKVMTLAGLGYVFGII